MTEILQVPRAGIGLGPHQRVGTADPAGGAATHHCLTVNKGLIWVNYNDLTATPHWKSWLVREIIPKWPYFRLVNYYNLPRYVSIGWHLIYFDRKGFVMIRYCHEDAGQSGYSGYIRIPLLFSTLCPGFRAYQWRNRWQGMRRGWLGVPFWFDVGDWDASRLRFVGKILHDRKWQYFLVGDSPQSIMG